MTKIQILVYGLIVTALLGGCASKSNQGSFDQRSYDRQNNAAEKSQNSL